MCDNFLKLILVVFKGRLLFLYRGHMELADLVKEFMLMATTRTYSSGE